MTTVRGWKVFDNDLTCRGFQFTVGKTYEHRGSVVMCASGFHFHHQSWELFAYYQSRSDNRVCEVLAHDAVLGDDKAVCRKITIVRELTWFEVCQLLGGSGYGYEDGYGNENGYGDGNGYGYGNGNGDGYGYGDWNGNGYGYGDGDGYGKNREWYVHLPYFIQFDNGENAWLGS